MKSRHITLHLEAPTPQALSVLTVRVQEKWGMTLDFFDFIQTKKGTFMCWYIVPIQKWAEAVDNGRS